jgi:hypothetical protein
MMVSQEHDLERLTSWNLGKGDLATIEKPPDLGIDHPHNSDRLDSNLLHYYSSALFSCMDMTEFTSSKFLASTPRHYRSMSNHSKYTLLRSMYDRASKRHLRSMYLYPLLQNIGCYSMCIYWRAIRGEFSKGTGEMTDPFGQQWSPQQTSSSQQMAPSPGQHC